MFRIGLAIWSFINNSVEFIARLIPVKVYRS